MSLFFLLPLLTAKFFGLAAYAEDDLLAFSGRVYTDQYIYTAPGVDQRFEQSSVSTWLTFDSHIAQGFMAHAVGQLGAFPKSVSSPDSFRSQIALREGYLNYALDGLDLRVGQQIIPWGKSDGVNPTDYFTAKDYTVLNPDDEVRRLGAPAVNLSFTPDEGKSPLTFQFVFQAHYAQTHFLIPTEKVPAGLVFHSTPPDPGYFQSNSMEYGMKVAYQKSDFDFSISGFHGYAALPEYEWNAETLSVVAFNPSETAFGADASFSTTQFIFRFETAFLFLENGGASDANFGKVEPNHWDTVIGVEHPIGNDFRIQAQFLYRYHLNFYDGAFNQSGNPLLDQINQGIAKLNRTLLNFKQKGNPGSTFRIAYAPENSIWSTEIFLLGYFSSGADFLIRPQISLAPIDNLKISAGVDLYGGNPDTPLGSLHDRSDCYLSARYLY